MYIKLASILTFMGLLTYEDYLYLVKFSFIGMNGFAITKINS